VGEAPGTLIGTPPEVAEGGARGFFTEGIGKRKNEKSQRAHEKKTFKNSILYDFRS
jgi:hypothetical protein